MKKTTIEAVNEFVQLVGGTTWTRIADPCTGDWKGTTDYGILIDGKIDLFVINGMRGFEARIREWINTIKTFRARKEYYLRVLREQAQRDCAAARAEGLHPVYVLDIGIISLEAYNGFDFLYPYALLEVNGKRFKFCTAGLAHHISRDCIDKWVEEAQKPVCTAGGVKTPDYIFGGVRFDSRNGMYCIR